MRTLIAAVTIATTLSTTGCSVLGYALGRELDRSLGPAPMAMPAPMPMQPPMPMPPQGPGCACPIVPGPPPPPFATSPWSFARSPAPPPTTFAQVGAGSGLLVDILVAIALFVPDDHAGDY